MKVLHRKQQQKAGTRSESKYPCEFDSLASVGARLVRGSSEMIYLQNLSPGRVIPLLANLLALSPLRNQYNMELQTPLARLPRGLRLEIFALALKPDGSFSKGRYKAARYVSPLKPKDQKDERFVEPAFLLLCILEAAFKLQAELAAKPQDMQILTRKVPPAIQWVVHVTVNIVKGPMTRLRQLGSKQR